MLHDFRAQLVFFRIESHLAKVNNTKNKRESKTAKLKMHFASFNHPSNENRFKISLYPGRFNA
jgi:hypothetical protein